jgi:hypothetical protein
LFSAIICKADKAKRAAVRLLIKKCVAAAAGVPAAGTGALVIETLMMGTSKRTLSCSSIKFAQQN